MTFQGTAAKARLPEINHQVWLHEKSPHTLIETSCLCDDLNLPLRLHLRNSVVSKDSQFVLTLDSK